MYGTGVLNAIFGCQQSTFHAPITLLLIGKVGTLVILRNGH